MAIKSLVIMGLWTVVILLISSITFLSSIQEGLSMGVLEVIIFELLCISPWIVFTPAIIILARTYRFEKHTIYSSIGVHLAAITVVFSLHTIVQSYTVSFYYDVAFSWSYIQRDFLGFIDMRVLLYVGILLAVYTIDFQKKNREIRLLEPRLKAELNKAKFQALLNQVQPDFLLNSIESIRESLDKDEEKSEEILTEFSDLLRIMLANVNRDEVTIREDLESYHLYTNILQKRLAQKIEVESNIGEKCYDALVPSFLMLIPVFEQIIDAINPKTDAIHSISYQAKHIAGKTHLEAVIEGKNIPYKEMPKLLQRIGFPEIIEKLQSKYGEDIELRTRTEIHCIRMAFVIPYLIAEDSEELVSTNLNEEISSQQL